MSLRLTQRERKQARAYRAMLRRVRLRCKFPTPPTKLFRGRQISGEHKAAIATFFCVATAVRFGIEKGGVHVAHLRFSNASGNARNPGLQRKPDDRWTLPLSPEEHRLQHRTKESAYWAELGVDPHALAKVLWQVSPDHGAMIERLRAETAKIRQQIELKTAQGDGAGCLGTRPSSTKLIRSLKADLGG